MILIKLFSAKMNNQERIMVKTKLVNIGEIRGDKIISYGRIGIKKFQYSYSSTKPVISIYSPPFRKKVCSNSSESDFPHDTITSQYYMEEVD